MLAKFIRSIYPAYSTSVSDNTVRSCCNLRVHLPGFSLIENLYFLYFSAILARPHASIDQTILGEEQGSRAGLAARISGSSAAGGAGGAAGAGRGW